MQSVVDQKTNFNLEVVIGEDCSTDGTRAIVEEFERNYPSIIKPIYHEKNVGAIRNAYEFCYPRLKGKYVACLEGDDYWTDPDKLQKQVEFLEVNSDFVICFHKALIEKDGVLTDDYITNPPSDVTAHQDLLKGNYMHTASVVFKNRLRKLPQWFTTALPTDHALYILLTANGHKVKMLNDTMSVYRVHAGGMWSLTDMEKFVQINTATMMNCAREVNIKNEDFIKYTMSSLALSITKSGFKSIKPSRYILNTIWAVSHTRYNLREIKHLFMAGLKGLLKA